MTYQEIKDRLSKCELTLEKIRTGQYNSDDIKEKTKQLTVLKESYAALLKEAEKGMVATDDEEKAKELADDGVNVKLTKEMKPGSEEAMEHERFKRLSPKDQEAIQKIRAMMQAEKDKVSEVEDDEDGHLGTNTDADFEREQLAQLSTRNENESEDTEGGDLDVGHQDDEPDMLKQYAYDIATYAAKLYKQLDKYDKMDGEVDFPNWWQSKVILAKDYISKAQHYLEFEEKQPAIDQLALEEGVEEASAAVVKKEYDALVGKMKQLAKHYKTAEGEKKEKIVAALKQHTARKRELEAQLDKAVAGTGAGQELDTSINERAGGADDIIELIKTRAMDATGDEQAEVIEVTEFMARHYFGNDIRQFLEQFTQEVGIDIEFGAGPSRQMQEAKGGKHVVRPCSAKNTPWAVWKTSADGENDKRIKGFKTKPEAKKFADEKNGSK